MQNLYSLCLCFWVFFSVFSNLIFCYTSAYCRLPLQNDFTPFDIMQCSKTIVMRFVTLHVHKRRFSDKPLLWQHVWLWTKPYQESLWCFSFNVILNENKNSLKMYHSGQNVVDRQLERLTEHIYPRNNHSNKIQQLLQVCFQPYLSSRKWVL